MFGLDTFFLFFNGLVAATAEPVRIFGFAGIAHYNGWIMAATGVLIVFSGLFGLSFLVSQLHKVVALLEPPAKIIAEAAPAAEQRQQVPFNPLDPDHLLGLYLPLIKELGNEFQIAELYGQAYQRQLPHPHLSIRCLREAGKLEFLGDGLFRYRA